MNWPTTLDFVWAPEIRWMAAAAVAMSVLLLRFRPAERQTVVNTFGLFAAGLAGQFAAAIVHALDSYRTAEVLHALFVTMAAIAVIRLSGFTLFRLAVPLVRARPPRIVEDLLIAAAYAVYAVVRLRDAGLDLSGLLATSAVITAVLAFSMQDTLGNVLGGLALQLDGSIQPGDWIRIDDVVGRVVDIRWRSTSIETRNWETVVVPNSLLMKSKFQVLGRRENQPVQLRRWVYFSIDPGVPPARVVSAAESAIREASIGNVSGSPPPNCIVFDMEGGNIRYALRYWLTDLAQDDGTDSQVRSHLFTALVRAGIRLAEPEQTVHLVQEDETHADTRRRRDLQRRMHAVNGVDLFSRLDEAEKASVAERLQYAPFASGDVMTRQGNISHWLYVLVGGEADIVREHRDGSHERVGKLGPGQYFGEMGLMTGAPRNATVVAVSDVECYRLDRNSFRDLLLARPAIAEEISRTIALRQQELDVARDAHLKSVANGDQAQGELLARIRRFFGLGEERKPGAEPAGPRPT